MFLRLATDYGSEYVLTAIDGAKTLGWFTIVAGSLRNGSKYTYRATLSAENIARHICFGSKTRLR